MKDTNIQKLSSRISWIKNSKFGSPKQCSHSNNQMNKIDNKRLSKSDKNHYEVLLEERTNYFKTEFHFEEISHVKKLKENRDS